MNTNTEPDSGMDVFTSPAVLRGAFERGLLGLLAQDSLGAFILVLANASFERSLFDRLQPLLASAFARWCMRAESADALATVAPADDVAVFRRLRELGFDRLAVTRWKHAGPWELQFNQLRELRPPRMSKAVVHGLREPFDPDGFHFNKPFLDKEVFWEGELAGAPVRLLYNKFPFAELHGLLVPRPRECRPQFLTPDDHCHIWEIGLRLGRRLSGLGFGYNAYGAYASVNHLHFQMFMRCTGRYPIESPQWRHNGGSETYPLPVRRFSECGSAWQALHRLHRAGSTYNLLYRPGVLYIAERAMQGSYSHSRWTGGFAWSELAGGITVSDSEEFERLSETDLRVEFGRLAVTP